MDHAARLKERTAELVPLVEACDYDPKQAYPYVPCCYKWLPQALREVEESYGAILRQAQQMDMALTEIYGETLSEEKKTAFTDYWMYSISALEGMINPTARMLADFDCLR